MAVQETAYGRYIIRSWPLGQLWQARAYVNDRQIGDKQTADDAETAVTRLKSYLDSREAEMSSGRGKDGSPSALEYAEAFDRLGRLNAGYEAMLDAHLNAPDYCITATQLADAAGYENYNAANLHYGTLGDLVAKETGHTRRKDGRSIATYALATDASQTCTDAARRLAADHGDEFVWHLRPQVVDALSGRRKKAK
jgi:hypothetical protein